MLVPTFKGKGDIRNCNTYRGVKLLENAMKIVERMLERRIRELVNIDSMQFGYMPERGTTDVLFVGQECKRNTGIRRKSRTCVLWILRRHLLSSKKGNGVGNEKKRFTRGNCKSGDEPLSRGKNKNSSGI